MEFDPTISLGSIVTTLSIVITLVGSFLGVVRRMDKLTVKVENHDQLILDIKNTQNTLKNIQTELMEDVAYIKGKIEGRLHG